MIRSILIFLSCLFFFFAPLPVYAASPDVSSPPTEAQLERGEQMAQKAIEAYEKGDLATSEGYWSQLIEEFPNNPAVWSNRGNTRVSQNKLEEALSDFQEAIRLAPNAIDPYINRGIALEGLGRWQEAINDYNNALELNPQEPLAYNNRGNAKAGLGLWEEALADYQKASELAPNFAFARGNSALMLYQLDQVSQAITQMRNLLRKYPNFPDMRAALTAVLWEQGKQGEAESNWVAAIGLDSRYQELSWVENTRRWPPKMIDALEKFLTID